MANILPETLELPTNGPEANGIFLDAMERCGRRLQEEGFDLDAYGQEDILDDVRDLAIAMGWRQINVQAALHLVPPAIRLSARYPGFVRALVLVEPFPPDHGVFDERVRYFDAALRAYYDACEEDQPCATAYPDLDRALPQAFDEFEREPVVVPVDDPGTGEAINVQIDGDRLVVAAQRAVGDEGALPLLAPALISNDQSSLVTVAAYIVQTTSLDPTAPWGAWNNQFCEDQNPEISRAGVSGSEAAYPLFRTFAHEPIFDLCERWPTHPGADIEQPGPSDVPAFILTGTLNPYSPPAFAQETARSFTNAKVAVFPYLTGGVIPDGPPCVAQLRLDFLRAPKAELAIDDCIARVPAIAFAGTSAP